MKNNKDTSTNDTNLGRRNLLKSAFVGGVVAAAMPGLARENIFHSLNRPVAPSDLDEITLAELQSGLKSGKFTARSIAEAYLKRIAEIDKRGPAVNSMIELNPDALEMADSLDREMKEKGPRGPMHGIPVVIKDNISTADKMLTTAGSLALVGSKPPEDSFVVRQLRKSGAVILGKTNLSEWANIRSSHSTSGWSGRGGLTRNPYALDRNTSGSSSGSAVAASANLSSLAIGTETDGSIVSPSSINGVVGIKPTVGLVSRTGIIPISHSQDTAGPIARSVRDAAILLGAMVGVDPRDKASRASKGKFHSDYTRFLDADGLEGARIGVVRGYFGFLPKVDEVIDGAIDAMRKKGAVIIDPVEFKTLAKWGDAEETVLAYELKADMNKYLATLGPNQPMHTLADLIRFDDEHKTTEMPYFGQDFFLKAEACGPLTDMKYIAAREKCIRLTRKEGIDAVMTRYNLDALVAPTDSPGWMTDLILGDHSIGGSSSAAAVAGYPDITVPAGFIFGLPVGISFFGRAWSEPKLIKLAYAFEQATKARRAPKFLPTADLKV